MTFNSVTFLGFLLIVLLLHNLPFSWRTRKLNLLWLSYLFYATWNPPFVLLIWVSTLVDWIVAARIPLARTRARRRMLLLASLGVNLGLLGWFKYGGFALESFVALCNALGIAFEPAAPDIILPVGISFYTFQTLSYTIDVYRGRMQPWPHFLDYALYVTFFPQLVAGPIVRATTFLPQCRALRRTTARGLSQGMALVVLGLFEKVVLADGLLAPIAEAVYDGTRTPDFVSAWCGTLAFSGQIFCDFAGYSTCAIGVALSLGFVLPENFDSPYAAVGFADFWRRWHISLSTWLRDYLYIPLGGNRAGRVRTLVNLMVTMLLGGLWHGAAWTFVVWGGLHGLYLMIERVLRERLAGRSLWRRREIRLGLGALTFAVITWTWAFFRANSLGQAGAIAGAMLGLGDATGALLSAADIGIALAVVGAVLASHGLMRRRTLADLVEAAPGWAIAITLSLMLITIATSTGDDRAFIYFRF